MANDTILKFFGSPTEAILMTGDIADDIFSVGGTNATITEFDNSTNKAPWARATINVKGTFAGVPVAGATIDLYMTQNDVDGTSDETVPTTTDKKGAVYVGSFHIYATDEAQLKRIVFPIAGVEKAQFFIQNKTGQTINSVTDSTVDVEGFTYTPSA